MSQDLELAENRFARFDISFDFPVRYEDTDPVIQKLFDEALRGYDRSLHPKHQPLERFLDEILAAGEQMGNPQYAMAVAKGYGYPAVQTSDDLITIYWTYIQVPDSRYVQDTEE